MMPAWLLPDHVSDMLPEESARVEGLRRRLLDLFASYGYGLIQPPLIEYADAMNLPGARDLDARSFKLLDPLCGRLLAIRPDLTPQAARIDAHLLNTAGVARLCYAASVLHAQPTGLLASREPIQVGCELYGHEGLEADLEIQELVLASLTAAGVEEVHLDLTDRGIFLALKDTDPGLAAVESQVLAALQAKESGYFATVAGIKPETRIALSALVGLYGPAKGPAGVIALARARLGAMPNANAIHQALDRLEAVAESALFAQHPKCRLTVDLADLQGWQYHNGIMFSAYCRGLPDALVRGGRYDGVGAVFGRARAATGFSLELRALASVAGPRGAEETGGNPCIAADWSFREDEACRQKVDALRRAGQLVAFYPSAQWAAYAGPRLVRQGSVWQVTLPAGQPQTDRARGS
jgi:ATP phosphoribosyltransferase regulatory subunit